MNRILISILSLLGFFLVWAVWDLTVVAYASEPASRATVPPVETTLVVSVPTKAGQIPVTGEPEPLWTEILLFYGLIAITASFLLWVLLNTVNQSMAARGQPKDPSSKERHRA
jgi:hypothetical protein